MRRVWIAVILGMWFGLGCAGGGNLDIERNTTKDLGESITDDMSNVFFDSFTDSHATDDVSSVEDLSDSSIPLDTARVCSTSWSTGWVTIPLSRQSENFQLQFTASPSHNTLDGVTGLSLGTPRAYSDLAVIVRFNPEGNIDARDGGVYVEPTTKIPYSAGKLYHFRLEVDMVRKMYDVFVSPEGKAEQPVGVGLAFRTEAQDVGSLDTVGLRLNPATNSDARHEVCDVLLKPYSAN